jgi:hypothetical protein
MPAPLLGRALHVCTAARPRASCLCHWGGRLLCCGAGVRWAKHVGAALRKQPAFLHSCGGAAAAAGGGRKGQEKANGFLPPWLLIVQT